MSENVFEEYDITVNGLKTFPIFIVNENVKMITVLRVLYQKQNWAQILRIEDVYHIRGKAI